MWAASEWLIADGGFVGPKAGNPVSLLQQSLDILARAETSLDIGLPAADIYAYLADFSRHPEWAHTYLSVEAMRAGSIGVGARLRVRQKQDLRWDKLAYTTIAEREGVAFTTDLEITALEQPRRIAWRSRVIDGPFASSWRAFASEWEFVLVPVSETITTVRMRGRLIGPPEAIEDWMGELRARGYPLDVVQRQVDRGMHNLRTILEGRATLPRA